MVGCVVGGCVDCPGEIGEIHEKLAKISQKPLSLLLCRTEDLVGYYVATVISNHLIG